MLGKKFKVGDKVVGSKHAYQHRVGKEGVVTEVVKDGSCFVCWDSERGSQYCLERELELVVESPEVDTFDVVSKPNHYNHSDGIECIDYIRQVLGKEGFIAYCRGNQIKYQHRAMYKGKPVEDLEKAHQYNAWAIEALKETKE